MTPTRSGARRTHTLPNNPLRRERSARAAERFRRRRAEDPLRRATIDDGQREAERAAFILSRTTRPAASVRRAQRSVSAAVARRIHSDARRSMTANAKRSAPHSYSPEQPAPPRAFGARSGAFPPPSRGGSTPTRDAR